MKKNIDIIIVIAFIILIFIAFFYQAAYADSIEDAIVELVWECNQNEDSDFPYITFYQGYSDKGYMFRDLIFIDTKEKCGIRINTYRYVDYYVTIDYKNNKLYCDVYSVGTHKESDIEVINAYNEYIALLGDRLIIVYSGDTYYGRWLIR